MAGEPDNPHDYMSNDVEQSSRILSSWMSRCIDGPISTGWNVWLNSPSAVSILMPVDCAGVVYVEYFQVSALPARLYVPCRYEVPHVKDLL
jgi:hypothetical protein